MIIPIREGCVSEKGETMHTCETCYHYDIHYSSAAHCCLIDGEFKEPSNTCDKYIPYELT